MAVNYDEIISEAAPVKPMQPIAPPSSANKYDDIIAEDQSQGAASLKENMYVAVTKNPDEHAKALDLSKKTGVPADLIDQDTLPAVQEAAAGNGVDYEKIHNKNPRVSNFLMNPDNAAVTHDDVPAMKKIDNTVEEYGWMQTILRGMAQGVNQIGSQASKVPAFMYDLWAYDASRGGETAPKILGLETGLPLQAPQSWRQNPVTDFFDSNSKYWEMPKLDKADLFDDIQDGNYRRAGIKLAHDVATSAPQSLALLAAAVSGFGIPALVGAGALSAADKKDQLQKQGAEGGDGADAAADPGRSLLNASLTGTFEAATEAIPMGALHHYSSAIYKSFGKQATKEVMLDFSKAIFGSAASEGIEETVNSFADDLTDWATGTNPNFDVAASTKRAMNAGVVGMASGGLMTGPSAIMAGAHRMTQERTAHHASEFYIEVGDQLDQTKVNERSTDVKKSLVHELTTGTDAEAVYVNPKDFATYFQSKNESPSKIAADLGVSKEYDNAVETGNDLKVPMAKWAEVLHGTDHYVGLKNDIKFDPEMQSVNELKESQAAHQEEMQKIDEQAKADADAAPKFDVAAPMKEKLIASGRFTDQEAQLAADHHARMIEGLSRQTGMPAEEILKLYQLNIGDGSADVNNTDADAMTLNQAKILHAEFGKKAAVSVDDIHQMLGGGGKVVESGIGKLLTNGELSDISKRIDEINQQLDAGVTDDENAALDRELDHHMRVLETSKRLAEAKENKEYHESLEAKTVRRQTKFLGKKVLEKMSIHGQKVLSAFNARLSANKEQMAEIKKAQDPKAGPYVDSPGITAIRWSPNYLAEPTGTIGEAKIQEPNPKGAHPDPLMWAEDKYKATKELILKHAEAGIPLTINTSSDLIAREGYIDILPPGTVVNMHMISRDEALNRQLFPGNASRLRQESAVKKLREAGIKVNAVQPTVESLVAEINKDKTQGKLTFGEKLSKKAMREMADKAIGLRVLNQDEVTLNQNDDGKGPRGQISFGKDNKFTIDFFKTADLSTAIHELSHFHFEVLGRLAQDEKAHASVKDDYAKILNWLGVNSKEEITAEHHEKFARGVEAYLMEGKAPVPELRSAFARIKAWMLHIYKDIRNLKIELNPEIRSVFDRLVAAEDQVKAAQHQQNQEPLFNQENAVKFLGAGADRYFEAAQEVKDFAEGKVTQKLMNDFNKAKSEIYHDKRKEVRASVEAEVNEERVYKTIDILQKGKLEDLTGTEQHIPDGAKRLTNIKLDKADLIAMIGAAEFEKIKNMKGTYIYSRLNGVHPDIAAILLGYSSGHQMIREILKAPDKTSVIEERTDKRMSDLFPDSFLNGALPEEAIEAVHNEKRSQILRMELDALVKNHPAVFKDVLRRITRRVPSDAEVKANAIKIVGSKSVGDVRPHIYALAERKSAKLAGEALAKGDVPLAIEHKLKELLNHEMYRAAIDAKEYIEKQFKQFKKIGRSDEAISKNRDTDIVNAARSILARFGIGKSGKTAESYLETMKREDADTYNSMMVLVNDATQKVGNYKDISFDDFHAMADAVGAMWDLAKSSREITIDGKKMDRDLAIGDLSNRLSDVIKDPGRKPGYHEAVTDAEKRGMLISGALASMKRTEHWADTVDGLAKGPFRKYIWNPISEAVTKYRLEKSKVISEYEKIIKEIAPRITREKIHSDELGYTFKDKAELLMAVLHSGNDSNLDKLLRGRNWGSINEDGTLDRSRWDKFIARMHAEKVLGKAEYDFAQKIWDLMESMKSGAQKAHKEMYGYYFNEITANKITTPFGEYRGGYVPAKVDVFTNEDAQIRNEREAFEKNNNSYQFPTTGRGFSKERVQQYAAPLSLELSLLAGHIDGVQRFTHIEPRIKEVSRIVMNKDFRAQLAQLDPSIAKDMLIPWLQRAAQQQVVLPSESGIGRMLDKGARYMRNTVAMQVMVGNIVNTLQQFTGLSVALTKVSAKHMRQGLVSYMTDTKNTVAVMLEKSDYMKSTQGSNIYETQQAIHDIIVNPTKIQKAQDFAKKHTYILQAMTQNVVNTITWTGAYNQAVANGELEAEAVRSADSAVRLTQGTNAPEDISRFETGTATARMFTQFAGYFNMLANVSSGEMTKTVRELGFKKGAGRLFYVYATAIMIPAVISEMMVRAASGKGLDEDDDDSYVDDLLSIFFGSQFRTVTAMIPHLGGVINAALGGFTQNRFDDRMNIAPAITFIENMAATPGEIYKGIDDEGDFKKKTVKDALMLMGILSSLPIGPLGKPIGYQMDVNSGAANPSGAVDYTRGLITGRPGKQ